VAILEGWRRASSRTEILVATGLLVLGFLLGLGSASLMRPALPPGEDRTASEMEHGVRSAMKETSAFARSQALGGLFTGLDAENVAGAARGMRTSSEFLDPVDLQLFLSAWTRFDALSAMAAAENWPSEAGREIGMRIVMREWAGSGRVIEAGNYYDSLQNPEKKSVVAGPLIRGWALSGDIEGALKRVRIFWDQGDPVNMVDGFVRGALGSVGTEELIEIVLALEPNRGGDFEHRLMRVTLNLGAREDPTVAANAYASLEGDSPPDWLHGALKVIARPWAETDSRAAIEWLLERADRPERTVVLKELMRHWALQDVDAAVGWWTAETDHAEVLGTDNRALRSILLPPLLRGMAQVRPVEASRWVEQVEKSVPRETLILRIAYFWAIRNSVDAQEWVDGLGLSEVLLEKARTAIARGAAGRQATEGGENGAFVPDGDSLRVEELDRTPG
jgi:hypothetical protein